MTIGDNPRISLLRSWSKARCGDLHTLQHALDQKFRVTEFPFGFLWNQRTGAVEGIKAGICSCQSWELKAGTDFGGSSICFTSSQKKKLATNSDSQIWVQMLSRYFISGNVDLCSQPYQEPQAGSQAVPIQVDISTPVHFYVKKKHKTQDQLYCYNRKRPSAAWK